MKRISIIMLALLLAVAMLPVSAFAARSETPDSMQGFVPANGRLVISEAGSYTLTGSMRGTVWVDPGAGDVELILDNVTLDGAGAPAIRAVSGDRLTVTMTPGSRNSVTDGSAANDMKAAVFSQVPMAFGGNGQMNINGMAGQGISVPNAGIDFNSGRYSISAPDACIAAVGPVQFGQGVTVFENGAMTAGTMPAVSAQHQSARQQPSNNVPEMNGMTPPDYGNQNSSMTPPEFSSQNNNVTPLDFGNQIIGMTPPDFGNQNSNTQSAASASEIVRSDVVNSAADLEADMDNAQTITVTEEDSQVKITSSGTYVVTGSSSNGNITVKKGTTSVVLVLEELDLTSATGATLSVNKEAEVKLIVSGRVTLTDAENPEDENSTDADVVDAFDGAAIKIKAGSQVYLTGDGTLTLNGNAKNGIKVGDEANLVMDGSLNVNISAANDGINANYDLTILGGSLTIEAGDDAIHADHILTIGRENGTDPVINVTGSNEGLEGTVVNMFGGRVTIRSTDDAINAANGDGLFEGELPYSFNMVGGEVIIRSSGDGIDSNGNVNLVGGTMSIQSGSVGGEAGIDYDGRLYIAQDFNMTNQSGTTGPEGMGGQMMGGMPGMNGQSNGTNPPDMGNQMIGTIPPSMGSQNRGMTLPDMNDQFSGMTQPGTGNQASGMTQPDMSRQPNGMNQPSTGNQRSGMTPPDLVSQPSGMNQPAMGAQGMPGGMGF